MARGLKVALLAFLIGLAFYLKGWPVTPWTMMAAGLLAWLLFALPGLLRGAYRDGRQSAVSLVACVATFAAVGGMY